MAGPGACPKCGVLTGEGEQFCAACGYALSTPTAEGDRIKESIGARLQKQSIRGKIKSGRTTIMVCAVLFTLGTGIIYVINTSAIAAEERKILPYKGNPEFDQAAVRNAEDQLDAARGQALALTAGNGFMALTCYVLWWWAKSRPLPATLGALILFLAVQLLNAAFDPATLIQGWLVKIIILIYLAKAVDAAQKFQKLQLEQPA